MTALLASVQSNADAQIPPSLVLAAFIAVLILAAVWRIDRFFTRRVDDATSRALDADAEHLGRLHETCDLSCQIDSEATR